MINHQEIVIVPYDPIWPVQFAELSAALAETLGSLALHIEHVGSTSVPGLAAKNLYIDLIIADRSSLPNIITAQQELGYEHEGDLGIAGREAFNRITSDVPRSGSGREWPEHHLYVCSEDNREYGRHVTFRDYLRRNPDSVSRYCELKHRLVKEFRFDRAGYSEVKSEFIVSILRDATSYNSLRD